MRVFNATFGGAWRCLEFSVRFFSWACFYYPPLYRPPRFLPLNNHIYIYIYLHIYRLNYPIRTLILRGEPRGGGLWRGVGGEPMSLLCCSGV